MMELLAFLRSYLTHTLSTLPFSHTTSLTSSHHKKDRKYALAASLIAFSGTFEKQTSIAFMKSEKKIEIST